MATNWYTQIIKRILGRSEEAVQSKGELRLKRLEDRRLLNADFALMGGELLLDNFAPDGMMMNDSTSLTITEGNVDINGSPGTMEDVYLFTLDAGTWQDQGGLLANQFEIVGGNVLAIDRGLFDGSVDLRIDDANGTAADANDLSVIIGDALPAANLIDFAAMTDITISNVGTITQQGMDGLAATSLTVTNAESVTLELTTNDFDTFSATTRIGVSYTDADDLTVSGITTNIDDATDGGDDASSVTINTGGNLTMTGAINSTGTAPDAEDDNITLTSGGALSITQAVNAGTADVSLTASGDIVQSGMGTITGNDLSVTQMEATAPVAMDPADLDMDMAHDVDLNLANAVDTFTASNAEDGSAITFNNSRTLSVGAVTSNNGAITITTDDGMAMMNTANINVNGLVSSIGAMEDAMDGVITITADGSLTLDLDGMFDGMAAGTAINSGMAAAMLTSSGNMTQDTDGLITSDNLSATQNATAAGNIALGENNSAAAFSATNMAAGGSITFNSNETLSVGAVTSNNGAITISTDDGDAMTNTANITINGVVSSIGAMADGSDGTISLTADGLLTINDDINAGQGDVILVADRTISQNADDLITANELSAQVLDANTAGDQNINLGLANAVDEFVADNDSAGGFVTFRSTRALTIDTFNGIMGVTTTNDAMAPFSNDISLTSDMALTINQPVNAGMANITLSAGGDITQNATGILTGNTLTITTANDVTLTNAMNNVVNLNAMTRGFLNYRDNDALTVTGITTDIDDAGDGIDDVATATVQAGGLLTVTGAINTTGAAANAEDDDISLTSGAALTLNQAVNAGMGDITLSAVGDITQNAMGIITGNTLTITTANDVTLTNAMNNAVNLNAMTRGFLNYRDNDALTVTGITTDIDDAGDAIDDVATATVLAGGALTVSGAINTTGAAANAEDDDITLTAGAALTLNQAVNAGMANVSLTSNGNMTQNATGIVTANMLTATQAATTGGNIVLDDGNVVNIFTGSNTADNGTVTFNNTQTLSVGSVTSDDGDITITTDDGDGMTNSANITVTGTVNSTDGTADASDGNILINADGTLDLQAAVTAGMGNVNLTSDGNMTQNATGIITGATLDVTQEADTGNIVLDDDNLVNAFTGSNAANNGTIIFHNTQTLSVGPVSSDDGDITITTDDGDGMTNTANINVIGLINSTDGTADASDGAILISADGTMTLDGPGGLAGDFVVNSGDAITRLVSNGSISQTADGLITADTLGVRQESMAAGANIDLCEANIVDNVFAANNASSDGFISFQSTQSFMTGTVAAVTGFTATTGVTTQGGDISLLSGGTLTIDMDADVNAMGGDVAFIGADVVLEEAFDSGAGDLLISDGGALDVNQTLTSTGTIRLRASGDITQSAVINATSLAVQQIGTTVPMMDMGATDTDMNGRYDIVLDQDNVVSNFAASNAFDGGVAQFKTTQNLTIRSIAGVTVKGVAMGATNGVSTTFTGAANAVDAGMMADDDSGDILIETDGSLTIALDGVVDGMGSGTAILAGAMGTADVRLIADGPITQDTDGLISANELGVELRDVADDNLTEAIDLRFNNAIDEFGATNASDNGLITIHSTRNLNIGRVSAQSSLGSNITFANQNGVTSTNGDILIDSQGALSIDLDSSFDGMAAGTAIDAGTATVRLVANGDLHQDTDGLITAAVLGARQDSATVPMAGDPNELGTPNMLYDILLCENNSVGTFAANNASAGGGIFFSTNQDLSIGSVTQAPSPTPMPLNSQALFGATSGLTIVPGGGAGSSIVLVGSGSITINAAIDAGATGDIQIHAGSFLNIQEDVDGDEVRLLANGDIFQGVDDIITANALAARQVGTTFAAGNNLDGDMLYSIRLGEDNVVGTFAANNAFEDGFINFRSTQNLTIGELAEVAAAGKNPGYAETTGVSTTDADGMVTDTANITIDAGGSLFLDEAVNATQTANVRLIGNGDITQDAEGIITARNLGVRQNNAAVPGAADPAELGTPDMLFSVDLCEANVVSGFAANNASAGGAIEFRSTQDLSLVTVAAAMDQNINFAETAGVTTTMNGDISLQSDMTLSIDGTLINANGGDVALIGSPVDLTDALDVGAGNLFIDSNGALIIDHAITSMNTIRLRADGDITQTAIITATNLAVQQAGTTIPAMDMGATDTDMNGRYDILLELDNDVDNFAASNAFVGGEICFKSIADLTIGSITGVTAKGVTMSATSGITTDDGDITIITNGNLIVNNSISSTGAMDDSNDGDILLVADGSVTINAIVDAGFIAEMPTGDVQINAGSFLNIQNDIDGNNVRLQANGDIFQGVDDIITANALAVRQVGTTFAAGSNLDADMLYTIRLGEDNVVSTFAANNAFEDGFINFRSTQNLTVGSLAAVTAAGKNPGFAVTTGVMTTDADAMVQNSANINIDAGGSLFLDEAVNATQTADVRLIGNGDISQDAEGIVTANELGVLQNEATAPVAMDPADRDMDGEHDVDLAFDNSVDEVAISNLETGSEINFHSTRNLTVGSVDAFEDQNIDFESPTMANGAVMGVVSANGDILIDADLSLTLDLNNTFDATGSGTAVNSGTATTRLVANGDIRQDSDGLITANVLGVRQDQAMINAAADLDESGMGTNDNAHDIDLGYANSVNTFAAVNAYDAQSNAMDVDGGIVTFQNNGNLTVGTVTARTMDGTASFTGATGVNTTYTGPAVASRDTDGDGTFETTDVLAGDILIVTPGSLMINAQIDAGGSSTMPMGPRTSDVRLAANGAVTQTADIDADELNVRQDAATSNTDITLTLATNTVNEFAAFNASDDGDISYTDMDDLNINVMTAQGTPHGNVAGGYATFAANGTRFDMNAAPMVQPIANVAVGASGGDIAITAGGNLTAIGVTDMANQRFIFSTDGTVDSTTMSDGEMITLSAVDGNITLGGNANDMMMTPLGHIIITTDEDTTAGVSAASTAPGTPGTNDRINLVADSDQDSMDNLTDGRVIFGDGTNTSGVQLRTDGGVAIQFGPRPETPLANGDFAFFSSMNVNGDGEIIAFDPVTISPDLTFNAFDVQIGVMNEENLNIELNFGDPNNDTISAAEQAAINTQITNFSVDNTVNSSQDVSPNTLVPDPANPTTEFLVVQTGGETQTYAHAYSTLDGVLYVFQANPKILIRFGVSHDPSLNVSGNSISQNGSTQIVAEEPLAMRANNNLSRTSDSDPTTQPTTTENGLAVLKGVFPPPPVVIEPDPAPQPNPAPPNPAPVIPPLPPSVAAVEPASFPSLRPSESSFDYFQLRRNEGEAGYEVLDERISEDTGESLLDPKTLREYVQEQGLDDEQDYELWLITTKVVNGRTITLERPILKFDVSGGRPIPAVEELPMEFGELKLEEIPVEEAEDASPMNGEEMEKDDSGATEKPDEEKDDENSVSRIELNPSENPVVKRVDGVHQASALGVGGTLAVSQAQRTQVSEAGRRVRSRSLVSRIFGGRKKD